MKKLLFACLSMVTLASLSALEYPVIYQNLSEKIYIDEKEMLSDFDSFHIHVGENIWIKTNTVHRDSTGLFTYDSDITKDDNIGYEKKWKCPYCHHYWPMGKSCKNKNCPSKFKDAK